MATLSEVALVAGVTTATVSNVLRNRGRVKAATVERVKQAVIATGYRPNLMARALSEGKSSMVAIVIPSITNPFYPEFARVAERVARQRKYFLVVCNTDEQPEVGRAYLSQIAGMLADGVVVLHAGICAAEILDLTGGRTPVVMASEETLDLPPEVPHVVVNFRLAGQIAGRHLLELGHRNIGVIVGRGPEGIMQYLRLVGFRETMAEANVAFSENNLRNTVDSVAGGRQAALSLLADNPDITAIFATNDLLAYGVSQALADRELSIPEDVSLIGITDIQMAQDMRPALTTVSLRTEELASASINLLLDLIENPAHQPTMLRVPDPQLVVRATTGAVRGQVSI